MASRFIWGGSRKYSTKSPKKSSWRRIFQGVRVHTRKDGLNASSPSKSKIDDNMVTDPAPGGPDLSPKETKKDRYNVPMEKFHFLLPSLKSMPLPYKLSRRRGSGASTALPWLPYSLLSLNSPRPRFPHSKPRRRRLTVAHGHRRSSAAWRVVSCPMVKIGATGGFGNATKDFHGATLKNDHATSKKWDATNA